MKTTTQDGYTEIEIPTSASEDDFIEVSLDEAIENEDDAPVVETPKQEAPKKAKPAFEQRKPSRAEKRIRELHSEKKQLEMQLEAERNAKAALQKQVGANSKTHNEDKKNVLQREVELLTAALKDAIESGDTKAAVEAQSDLIDAKMKLAAVTSALINQVEEVEDTTTTTNTRAPSIPENAREWIETYPQFKTDPVFHGAALAVNNTLVREGWDPESEEFYEEITNRLSSRFPDIFGTDEENVVTSDEDGVEYTQSSDEDGEDGESPKGHKDVKKTLQQNKPQAKQVTQQTVAASSRTSSPSAKPPNKKTVTLTQAEATLAKKWGISLEEMAKRKMYADKNRTSDGYSPIFIEN